MSAVLSTRVEVGLISHVLASITASATLSLLV